MWDNLNYLPLWKFVTILHQVCWNCSENGILICNSCCSVVRAQSLNGFLWILIPHPLTCISPHIGLTPPKSLETSSLLKMAIQTSAHQRQLWSFNMQTVLLQLISLMSQWPRPEKFEVVFNWLAFFFLRIKLYCLHLWYSLTICNCTVKEIQNGLCQSLILK